MVLFLISRYINKTTNGIEFWFFMPLAYVFCMVHCTSGILLVKLGGAGRHYLALLLQDPNRIITWSKLDAVEEYTYMVSVTFPKLAILSLYLRVFAEKPFRMAAYVTGGIIIMNCIAGILLSSVICRPFAYRWDKTIPGGKCGDLMAAYRFIGLPNLITDVVMLVLPLPVIYKLQVHLPAKIGLLITFVTGSFGIVTSVIRMVEFFTVDLFADPTFNSIPTMKWTIIEPGVYLIAATLPTLRPLKRMIFKDLSFTSFLSARFSTRGSSRATSKGASKNSYRDDSRAIKTTTDIKMESVLLVEEDASTKSMVPGMVPGRGSSRHNHYYEV